MIRINKNKLRKFNLRNLIEKYPIYHLKKSIINGDEILIELCVKYVDIKYKQPFINTFHNKLIYTDDLNKFLTENNIP